MIQRINFLQKQTFEITYAALLVAFGSVLLICLLSYGVTRLKQGGAERRRASLTTEINKLKEEREQLLHRGELSQTSGPWAAIQQALEKEPSWPQLLSSLAASLPPNVWLVSFKSFSKEGNPDVKGIVFHGSARSQQAVAAFLTAMGKTPHFEKIVLTSSDKEQGLFHFSASCDIKSPQASFLWKR